MLGHTVRSPQRLVLGLEQSLASDHPSEKTSCCELLGWDFFGKLCEDFYPWKHTWKGRYVGNIFFSHSSSISTGIKAPLPTPIHSEELGAGAEVREKRKGDPEHEGYTARDPEPDEDLPPQQGEPVPAPAGDSEPFQKSNSHTGRADSATTITVSSQSTHSPTQTFLPFPCRCFFLGFY